MKGDKSALDQKILDIIYSDDFRLSDLKPSDWAEENRIMTSDVSPYPGPFKYDRTPYLKEVVNLLMPDNPATRIAIMKGAQIGYSTGLIENGIGWIMSQNPTNILLAARDEGMVKDMMDSKIDQMIDSCDLRKLIRPNVMRAKNQRTGDTSMKKEFSGGSLKAYSIQKPGRMRQVSAQIGFLDDFEAAPSDKDAGAAFGLFQTRFAAYGDRAKVFMISTPEVKQTSNIEGLYLQGDQRRYFVPCPCCGDFITLEWKTIGANGKHAGITWKLDEENDLIDGSVGYTCQSCAGFFTDGHKYDINLAGEWRSTVVKKDKTFISYQISSLYSPPGMNDWNFYVKEYLKACPHERRIDIEAYKVFVNTCLGLTWEERGRAPKVTKLATNTRPYEVGIIPQELSLSESNGEIVLVTCACDLNGKDDDARLDYEIVAWSERGVSYSVDHGSIGTFIPRENTVKKKVDRERWSYDHFHERNVWNKFMEIITKNYFNENGDQVYNISIMGIDTGHFTQNSYQFMDRVNEAGVFCVGLKGKGLTTNRRIEANTTIYSKSKERTDLYLVEVNQVKDELASLMNLNWIENDDVLQPNGFMNFPTPSENKYTMKSYFSHFESEQKILKTDTSGKESAFNWEKRNGSVMNHFWDVKIYNMTVKEIMMDLICKEHGVKEPNWYEFTRAILG